MLTTFEEEEKIFKALCAGACSYISKRTSLVKIQEALFVVHRGGSYMSPSIARKIAGHFMPKVAKEGDALTPRQHQIVGPGGQLQGGGDSEVFEGGDIDFFRHPILKH